MALKNNLMYFTGNALSDYGLRIPMDSAVMSQGRGTSGNAVMSGD